MDNGQKRNVVILILLFVFTFYSLKEPFFFNSMANSRLGRLLMVSFIIFASYYNIYLGFLSTLLVVSLTKNLENENIANIKPIKPLWVEPNGFYKYFGYERVRENFETRRASNRQGKAISTLKTQDVLKRLDNDVYQPEQKSDTDKLKDSPDISDLEKKNTSNLYISDLLNIQNTLRPKDSSTMISSPVFLVK